tara:strand:- start:67 stop:513 length:447 start_codon:yes stop_codon:yes gene_type:complete
VYKEKVTHWGYLFLSFLMAIECGCHVKHKEKNMKEKMIVVVGLCFAAGLSFVLIKGMLTPDIVSGTNQCNHTYEVREAECESWRSDKNKHFSGCIKYADNAENELPGEYDRCEALLFEVVGEEPSYCQNNDAIREACLRQIEEVNTLF